MVIEFQKRGLPHAHILVILQQSDKPITDDEYDKFVCAEMPNPTCTKSVPKPLSEATTQDEDSFPSYS